MKLRVIDASYAVPYEYATVKSYDITCKTENFFSMNYDSMYPL